MTCEVLSPGFDDQTEFADRIGNGTGKRNKLTAKPSEGRLRRRVVRRRPE
jgi:hypothetical protein